MIQNGATPAARKAAQERRIDLAKIAGTGIGGYIQLSDVMGYKGVRATPLAGSVAAYYKIDLASVAGTGDKITKADVLKHEGKRSANIIPVKGMRAVIAKRMQESLRNAPQYTNNGTVCVYALKDFLKSFTEKCVARTGVKPTYSDLFIKAAAMALRDNMMMNSSFRDTYIEIHESINVGLAVALDDGLIVPNIKNADQKSLETITLERKALVDKARAGRLLPEDYTGGTFTISNMGQYPVDNFTPIINLPEAAILGIGTITDQVVPVDGNIGIRPIMGYSVTSDHRHIDGVVSGKFMKRWKEILENPTCME